MIFPNRKVDTIRRQEGHTRQKKLMVSGHPNPHVILVIHPFRQSMNKPRTHVLYNEYGSRKIGR